MSRSRSAMMNWLSSLSFTFVTMISGFVITPKVLNVLGGSRFGLARTLTETLAYFTLVGQGISLSLIPAITRASATEDREALYRAISVGVRAYLFAALTVSLLGLAITPALEHFIKVDPSARPELRAAWLLALGGIPLMALAPLKIMLDVNHRGYLVSFLMTAQGVLTAVGMLLLVWAGWGVRGVMLATLGGAVFYYASLLALNLWLFPRMIPGAARARPSRGDWMTVGGLLVPTLVALLCERIGTLSDAVFLSVMISTESATLLFVTQRLAVVSATIVGAISGAVWPTLAEALARGDLERLNLRLRELTRLVCVLGAAVMGPVIAFNPHFLRLWVGPGKDGGRAIVVAAALNATALALVSMYTGLLVSSGKVRRLVWPGLASALINVAASVVMTRQFGTIGPLLGTSAATLAVYSWYLPRLLRREFGTSLRGLLQALAPAAAWGAGFVAALSLLADAQGAIGWVLLLAEMAAASLAFLVLAWGAILDRDDRDLWRARLIHPLMARLGRARQPAPST